MTDILIGHAKETRRTIFIDVEVSARGLSLIVCVPFDVTHTYPRHSFAPWGSKRPPHSVKECGTPYMIDGFRLRKGGT